MPDDLTAILKELLAVEWLVTPSGRMRCPWCNRFKPQIDLIFRPQFESERAFNARVAKNMAYISKMGHTSQCPRFRAELALTPDHPPVGCWWNILPENTEAG